MKKRPQALPHLFMPGQTVTGAIKKLNLYDVKSEEMEDLLKTFKHINPPENPRPGVTLLIPILERHHAAVLLSKEVTKLVDLNF